MEFWEDCLRISNKTKATPGKIPKGIFGKILGEMVKHIKQEMLGLMIYETFAGVSRKIIEEILK